jgi:hypothetical protein
MPSTGKGKDSKQYEETHRNIELKNGRAQKKLEGYAEY